MAIPAPLHGSKTWVRTKVSAKFKQYKLYVLSIKGYTRFDKILKTKTQINLNTYSLTGKIQYHAEMVNPP
jgi:hypothetical protein